MSYLFKSRVLNLLLIVALVVVSQGSVLAQEPDRAFQVTPLEPESIVTSNAVKEGQRADAPRSAQTAENGGRLVSVIVRLDDEPVASYSGGVPGLAPTNPRATGTTRLDVQAAASQNYRAYLAQQQRAFEAAALNAIPSARVVHHFQVVFGGVSMLVPEDQIGTLASLPGVEAVYRDELMQVHTERSPYFIGADHIWEELGGQAGAGEGVIVGVLDTGIWPEHPSFSDPDPSGRGYAAPPAKWTGTACEFGSDVPGDEPFSCNNKLIGADRFMDTYDAFIGLLPAEFPSARDDNGHGTHTASTAAGNAEVEAAIFEVSRGTISGISPRSHVAMYKVCGDQGCFQSDSVAAIEQAIQDGVDAINFSISGGSSPYSDPVELAFLDTYAAGVFVAASAGNSGPAPDTTDHRGPWVTTIAASTTDRHFLSTVTLRADNGDSLDLVGATVTAGIETPTPVVNAADYGDGLCLDPFPEGTFSGEIVICERGIIARVEKSFNVAAGGAGGLLLYNPALQGLNTDNHFIPSVHLEYDAGIALLDFTTGHSGVTATFTAGEASTVQGDVMAAFSSRGGPGQTLGISKPDLTAPGVQILAGHTPLPATPVGGPPGELFQAIQGTSMSSPHVAGAAALLKALHPDWTPGQIKSALMTTALTEGVVKEDGVTPSDPFDRGSGRIDLTRAGDPGLTFDVAAQDYLDHAADLWSVNYPSLYVPIMPGRITVQRMVHSELAEDSTWQVSVSAPPDLRVRVPRRVRIPAGGDATFSITVDATRVPLGEVRHAALELMNGDQTVHYPITIVRRQPAVTLEKSCDPTTLARGETTDCTITATNTSFVDATIGLVDRLPKQLRLLPGSVSGATQQGNRVVFEGTLAAADPPNVTVEAGPSPAGYLPLAAFGVQPIGGVGDETLVNLTTPEFLYAGEVYSSIAMVSNGYAVVGGGTAEDIDFVPQTFPDPNPPNNVIAPFWTDLNGGAGGNFYAALLTEGVTDWIVLEWEEVPEFSTSDAYTFQIWIETGGAKEDISIVYGRVDGDGDPVGLSVGAENKFGNSGDNWGAVPTTADEIKVVSLPGTPGESHVVTFSARGVLPGNWMNCAEMTGDIFFGTNIACASGQVTR